MQLKNSVFEKMVACLLVGVLAGCGGGSSKVSNGTSGVASTWTINSVSGQMGGNYFSPGGGRLNIQPMSCSVSLVAGGASTVGSQLINGVGANAGFWENYAITTDGNNLYVADYGNHAIRKVDLATNAVSTLAGGAGAGYADGTGITAKFNSPSGITTDGTNLYVADEGNHAIRKVVIATGVVSTLAGAAPIVSPTLGTIGIQGFLDGIGVNARFAAPRGITVAANSLYITDMWNDAIRKLNLTTNEVTTVAGGTSSATVGFTPTDGIGKAATFAAPRAITTDGTYLYVAETTALPVKLRRISIATSAVETSPFAVSSYGFAEQLATDGTKIYMSGSDGKLYAIDLANNSVMTIAGGGISPLHTGLCSDVALIYARGIALTSTALYLVSSSYNGPSYVMKIN